MRKRIYPIFCLLSILIPAMAVSAKPDLTTPQATVQAFVKAINTRDMASALQCVQGNGDPKALQSLDESLTKQHVQFAVTDVRAKVTKDEALATLNLTISQSGAEATVVPGVQNLTLHHSPGGWKIVPLPLNAVNKNTASSSILLGVATLIANPSAFNAAREAARSASCMSNLKQLALGCIVLAQDNGEKFVLKSANFQNALTKYGTPDSVYHCPSDPGTSVSYSFNEKLEGVSERAITLPESTVLVYEGHGEKLDFRHDGKAHVAFADGHVREIDPTQAKGLLWKP